MARAFFDLGRLDPAHGGTKFFADLLDRVLSFRLADGVEVFVPTGVFGGPFLGELAVLDILQLGNHALLDGGVDDLRADGDVAVFRGLGDRESHPGDALLVHQVDDELELVKALEVGHFRLESSFDEHFETGFHQCRGATAEDDLLAKEVGHGFFAEVGFKDAGAGAADATCPGEGGLLGLAGDVLVDCDEAGHAFARHELRADGVARAFRGYEDHVDIFRAGDGFEMHSEAVGEKQGLALAEVRRDVFVINGRNHGVRSGDEDHVRLFYRLSGVHDLKAELLGNFAGLRLRVEADDDLEATVLEIKCMGMAL